MERPPEERSIDLPAAALAGALGGVAAGVVKLICEAIAPPRSEDRPAPAAVLLEQIAGHELPEGQTRAGSLAIHFALSIATSAGYALAVEVLPLARLGGGTAFGLAFWAGAHEYALPQLGLTPALPDLPAGEQVNEAITHALFGAVVEGVRAGMRGRGSPQGPTDVEHSASSIDGLQ